jgi:hypothetical protein
VIVAPIISALSRFAFPAARAAQKIASFSAAKAVGLVNADLPKQSRATRKATEGTHRCGHSSGKESMSLWSLVSAIRS